MSRETEIRAHGTEGDAAHGIAERGQFSFDQGFLGIVMDAAKSEHGLVRAALEGIGEVSIDCDDRRFVANVDDWERFCLADAGRFRVTRQSARAPSSERSRDLAELQWIAGYHTSGGRLPSDANRHAVVKLLHWPNLSRLPRTPDMHRLCALLARRPSSLHLAGKLLGIDEAQTFRFFSAAYAAGALDRVTRTHGISAAETEDPDEAAPPPSETSLGSMLKQLWTKMTGR